MIIILWQKQNGSVTVSNVAAVASGCLVPNNKRLVYITL